MNPYHPNKYGRKSRRQSLRIPEKLDDALIAKAREENTTKSDMIVGVLAGALNVDLDPAPADGLFD